MTAMIEERFPGISILSQTSREVRRNLNDFSIDGSIRSLNKEPIGRAITVPHYRERYCPVVRVDHRLADRDAVAWAEAYASRSGLPTPNMQNRRIVDGIFSKLNCYPDPEIKSNSFISLYSYGEHPAGAVPVGARSRRPHSHRALGLSHSWSMRPG